MTNGFTTKDLTFLEDSVHLAGLSQEHLNVSGQNSNPSYRFQITAPNYVQSIPHKNHITRNILMSLSLDIRSNDANQGGQAGLILVALPSVPVGIVIVKGDAFLRIFSTTNDILDISFLDGFSSFFGCLNSTPNATDVGFKHLNEDKNHIHRNYMSGCLGVVLDVRGRHPDKKGIYFSKDSQQFSEIKSLLSYIKLSGNAGNIKEILGCGSQIEHIESIGMSNTMSTSSMSSGKVYTRRVIPLSAAMTNFYEHITPARQPQLNI